MYIHVCAHIYLNQKLHVTIFTLSTHHRNWCFLFYFIWPYFIFLMPIVAQQSSWPSNILWLIAWQTLHSTLIPFNKYLLNEWLGCRDRIRTSPNINIFSQITINVICLFENWNNMERKRVILDRWCQWLSENFKISASQKECGTSFDFYIVLS